MLKKLIRARMVPVTIALEPATATPTGKLVSYSIVKFRSRWML